jgi:hypothetical protein
MAARFLAQLGFGRSGLSDNVLDGGAAQLLEMLLSCIVGNAALYLHDMSWIEQPIDTHFTSDTITP